MRPSLPALLALLLVAGAARAQSAPVPADPASQFSVSGFATAGLARSNNDQVEFVRYNQAQGATGHVSPILDSNLGLQVAYAFDPATALTAQAVIHRQPNGLYQPELALAFLRHKLGDDWTVRVGRLPAATYMTSEYLHVGYAITMARPPSEVYTAAVLESLDGVDVNYQHSWGATTIGAQLLAGRGSNEVLAINGGGRLSEVHVRLMGLALTLENGALLLRAGFLLPQVKAADTPALAGLRLALAQAGYGALANDLTLAGGRHYSYSTIGMLYDAAHLQVQAEFVRRNGRDASFVPDTAAWYAMVGYRLGKWLPYYAHARLDQTGNGAAVPATFPSSGALAHAVRYTALTSPEQHTNLVGVRWNLAPERAVKLQLDRVRPTTKNGTLVGGPAGGLKTAVTVLSMTLDVVF